MVKKREQIGRHTRQSRYPHLIHLVVYRSNSSSNGRPLSSKRLCNADECPAGSRLLVHHRTCLLRDDALSNCAPFEPPEASA